MPELPEVETVKEILKEKLVGLKIKDVTIYHDNIIAYPTVLEFKKRIVNNKILDVERRGKFLVFVLDDYYLLSHLRMEGKYFFKKKEDVLNKHEHVLFDLDNDLQLRYMDTRKFGKMYLILKEDILKMGPLKDLGLEPFDEKLDSNYLRSKLKNKVIPIKTALLDQTIITGIGNIYANEILFRAKIVPLKKANMLNEEELSNIINYAKEVLSDSILKGGTTIHSYTAVDGVSGRFQNDLLVHGRNNLKCLVCNTEIKKIKIGGRGTYYCPSCQK